MRQWVALLAFAFLSSHTLGQEATFPPPAERPVLEARRASGAIIIDGRLDEPEWLDVPAARGFRQIEPKQGEAPSFDTEVRILFDENNLYVGAICHDDGGLPAIRVPDLRRDWDYYTNDLLGVVLDPWGDDRAAISFQVNPYGALRDLQVFDDVLADREWDAVWTARTTILGDRWIVEIAIPWSTLRYPAHASQWGVNFVRSIRRTNELTGWSPWPRAYSPYRLPYAGVLRGIEPPPPRRNIRFNPYAVAKQQSVGPSDESGVQIGGDLKWAIRPSTVLDATVNTDFAQADVDRQVVNLNRFSVFFPEKRQFFLENASLFSIGDSSTVKPFFTRRIGLDDAGNPLPIAGGLRYVDRTSDRSIGGLLVRTRGENGLPASTFGVARFVENIGTASRVGGTFVGRDDDGRRNSVFAVDGFFRVTPNLAVETMVSRSATTGEGGEGVGTHLYATYRSNRAYAYLSNGIVTENYRADAGFIPRANTIRTAFGGYPTWRPAGLPKWLRALEPDLFVTTYHRASDRELEEATVTFAPLYFTFQNGGNLRGYVDAYRQRLDAPFSPLPGVSVDTGEYDYLRYGVRFVSDQSRRVRATVTAEEGDFYDGRRTLLDGSVTYAPSPRAAFGIAWQENQLRDIGPSRTDRTTRLVAPEIRLALNPRLQFYAFYQHNTAAEAGSLFARFSWEYRPLSFVYLVLNDRTALDERGFVSEFPRERQVILKFSFMGQM